MRRKLPSYDNYDIADKINRRIHDKVDRQILRMKLIDGMTFDEVAYECNIPYGTVTDHYYKQLEVLFYDFPGE